MEFTQGSEFPLPGKGSPGYPDRGERDHPKNGDGIGLASGTHRSGDPRTIGVSLPTQVLLPTIIQGPLEDGGLAGHAVTHPGEGQHADLVQRVLAQPSKLGTAGGVALRHPEPGIRIRALLLVHHLQQTPCDMARQCHIPWDPPGPCWDGAAWLGLAQTGTRAAGRAHLVAQDEAVAVCLGDVAPSDQHAAGGGGQRRHVAGARRGHWRKE